MKMTKIFLAIVLATMVNLNFTSAQIEVFDDGAVRVGTGSHTGALNIGNTSKVLGLNVFSRSSNIDSKITGISNSCTQDKSNTKSIKGFYNNATALGNQEIHGIQSRVRSSANNKTAYGFHNELTSSNYLAHSYGIYNHHKNINSGSLLAFSQYGMYNLMEIKGKGAVYGHYNKVVADNESYKSYGIYTEVSRSAGIKESGSIYGIYSKTSGDNSYAGYFDGDVHITGNANNISDESTKENVKPIVGALGLINKLQPKTYSFRSMKEINLPQGQQYGFLAQDLEKVLPDLVTTIDHPVQKDKNDKGGSSMELKSVNYTALIPVLVQAVKDQQRIIKQQQKDINALKAQLKK